MLFGWCIGTGSYGGRARRTAWKQRGTYVRFIASGQGMATVNGSFLSVDSTADLRVSMLLRLIYFARYEGPHLSPSTPIFYIFLPSDYRDSQY